MSRKIMIVTGSNRQNGNTATLAKWVADGARRGGAEVEIVDMARINSQTHGCTACMRCQASANYRCAIDDEVSETLAKIPGCSTLVLASPVYFLGFSAQLKMFIDRMFSLIKISPGKGSEHALKNTRLALLASCGGDEAGSLSLIKSHIDGIAAILGKETEKFVVPFAPGKPGDIDKDKELREKAGDFGLNLAKATQH